MGPTFSVGVDVDSLWHYYRIHGLDDSKASDHAWSHGVPRFTAMFKGLDIPASFYCVAEDIERSPHCLEQLKALVHEHFEIGNHSWHHPYSLTQLTPHDSAAEITSAKRLLENASQIEVTGFRAPGYHTHAQFHKPLIDSGHRYESSAFPCAPYYIAKAMVMGGMRLMGKRSQSILGSPRLLTAPTQPYMASPESPYRHLSNPSYQGFPHYPISVWCGLPLIGTLFSLLGIKGSAWLGRRVAQGLVHTSRHLTIEFHAADLLSLVDDPLDPQLKIQPDLKRSLSHKRAAFEAFLSELSRVATPYRLDQHPHTLRITPSETTT